MAIVFKYATSAQVGAAFRLAYLKAKPGGDRCARLATWALARIADGTFTDTQVRNFFGLTTPQYNALKTKWQTLSTNWAAVLAAQGE